MGFPKWCWDLLLLLLHELELDHHLASSSSSSQIHHHWEVACYVFFVLGGKSRCEDLIFVQMFPGIWLLLRLLQSFIVSLSLPLQSLNLLPMFFICQLSKFLLYWVPINVFFVAVVVFFLFYDASWSGDDDPQEDLAKFE